MQVSHWRNHEQADGFVIVTGFLVVLVFSPALQVASSRPDAGLIGKQSRQSRLLKGSRGKGPNGLCWIKILREMCSPRWRNTSIDGHKTGSVLVHRREANENPSLSASAVSSGVNAVTRKIRHFSFSNPNA
jgi:hypothetical protein